MAGFQMQDPSSVHDTGCSLSPAERPQIDRHPMAWRPEDFDEANPSIVAADELDRNEVHKALATFKALGLDGDLVDRGNFPLPNLGDRLDRASHNVHEGTGFAIVRGLDLDSLTVEDKLVIFLGVASYMGDVRGCQSKHGTMISHITDSKLWTTVAPELRHGIHTSAALSWHSDMGADVLALHVRAPAKLGGATFLASSWTVYQELEATRPDIIKTLSQPAWPLQVSGNPPRFILAPLLQVYKDRIFFSVDPGRLGLHPATSQHAKIPAVHELTDAQREALDVVSQLATKNRYRVDAKTDDMIFINNWSLLHAREAYVDFDTIHRRHLVRLWLRNSKRAWDIPRAMKTPWEAAFGPKGDGNPVYLAGSKGKPWLQIERQYPAVPCPVYKPPRYTAGSAAYILEDDGDVNARDNEDRNLNLQKDESSPANYLVDDSDNIQGTTSRFDGHEKKQNTRSNPHMSRPARHGSPRQPIQEQTGSLVPRWKNSTDQTSKTGRQFDNIQANCIRSVPGIAAIEP